MSALPHATLAYGLRIYPLEFEEMRELADADALEPLLTQKGVLGIAYGGDTSEGYDLEGGVLVYVMGTESEARAEFITRLTRNPTELHERRSMRVWPQLVAVAEMAGQDVATDLGWWLVADRG